MSYSELQRRQDALARNRENRGRLATVSQQFVSTGVGTVEYPDRIDFGVIFIEKPIVQYGNECDADDLRNLFLLTDNDPITMPMCSGSVVSWDINDDGDYVGAWVATTVAFTYNPAVYDPAALVVVTHHFHFIAVALKLIPQRPNLA